MYLNASESHYIFQGTPGTAIGIYNTFRIIISQPDPGNNLRAIRNSQLLAVAALDTIIEYHREKADTPGIQCHRLRHTCFTRLRQEGMSLEALQAQAGHKSIVSTRIYLHLCPKELQQEYLRMADSLFSPPAASRRSENG